MQLLPAASTVIAPPRYDADAHALYVHVGALRDRHVAETRSGGGINFDCNADGFVVGVEVLLNASQHLQRQEVTIPRLVAAGWHNLRLDDDPDLDDAQTYDGSNRTVCMGTYDGAAPVFRIAEHVLVAPMPSGHLVVWITGLDIPRL